MLLVQQNVGAREGATADCGALVSRHAHTLHRRLVVYMPGDWKTPPDDHTCSKLRASQNNGDTDARKAAPPRINKRSKWKTDRRPDNAATYI